MKNQPLVTVIMPVYNGERTIQLAINSLLNQTYNNWLCVIVNDCSTDGTAAILSKYENNNRFKIIYLPVNKGRGNARQVALENSEGDYICFLDADDFYHKDKILKQVTVLHADTAIALVGTLLLTFDSNFDVISLRGYRSHEKLRYNYRDTLHLAMPTSMIRRNFVMGLKYDLRLNASEDLDFFSKYLIGREYLIIQEPLLFYSVTESTNYKKILEYTKFDILRGIFMIKQDFLFAIRIIIVATFKWLSYAFFIPVLGVEFFLNRRGKNPEPKDIQLFNEQRIELLNK